MQGWFDIKNNLTRHTKRYQKKDKLYTHVKK